LCPVLVRLAPDWRAVTYKQDRTLHKATGNPLLLAGNHRFLTKHGRPLWLCCENTSADMNQFCPTQHAVEFNELIALKNRSHFKTPVFKEYFSIIFNFYTRSYIKFNSQNKSIVDLFIRLWFHEVVSVDTNRCIASKV
jgi:hypothetical protein